MLWLLMLAWNLYNYSGYYSLHSASPMPLTRTPRVSILVPARNEAAMLPSTLPGLLQQDYPDYEVVLVDNGIQGKGGEPLDERLRANPLWVDTPVVVLTSLRLAGRIAIR